MTTYDDSLCPHRLTTHHVITGLDPVIQLQSAVIP
jgi:hypothetical protein